MELAGPFVGHGIDPIGTAGHYHAVLLMEWALPWPKDIFDAAALDAVAVAVADASRRGERWRVLAAIPTDAGEGARLVRYSQPDGPFGGPYERSEVSVAAEAVPAAVAAIVAAGRTAALVDGVEGLDGVEGARSLPADGAEPRLDLLVCTHGSRDRRCGSMGMALHQWAAETGFPGVRLWRISHTGGHRFAPTAITLPDGMFWSHLTPELLSAVVHRSAAPAGLAAHVRGWAGAPTEAQPLDRAGLIRHGWAWLDAARRYEVVPGEDGAVVSGEARLDGGASVHLRGLTGVSRRVPTISCDTACDDATLWTDELGLLEVAVSPG